MKWIFILMLPGFAQAAPMNSTTDVRPVPAIQAIQLDKYLTALGPDFVKESMDTEGTGTPDTFVIFKKMPNGEKQMVMQLFDLNHDKKIDLVKHYAKGSLVKTEADLDYDGKVDVVSEYDPKNGNLIRKIQSDGKTNIVKYWYNNELRRKELDRNADGKPDMWVYYQGGKVVKTEIDMGFDGKNIKVEQGSLNKKVQ